MVPPQETIGFSVGNHRFLLEEPLGTVGAPNGILEDDTIIIVDACHAQNMHDE